MYVTISGQGKYRVIQFREDTRIPGTKKRKAHVVKTLGNYEKLLAQNPNILEELRAQAKKLTEEKKASQAPISLELASDVIYSEADVSKPYYFGHGLILQLWKNLKLDSFFAEQGRKEDIQPVIDAIFYLLLQYWADCLSPCSADQGLYAGIEEMSVDQFYDTLGILGSYKESLPQHLAGFFSRNTTRNIPRASYYLSSYAFGGAKEEETRKSTSSKEDGYEALSMGLLIDSQALPLGYELFAGKTLNSKTLGQSLADFKKLYKLDGITLVADRSLYSDHDLSYFYCLAEDFIISYTLIRSSEKFKAMVMDDRQWASVYAEKTGKILSREKVVEEELSFKLGIDKKEEERTGDEEKKDHSKEYQSRTLPVKIHLTWTAARAAKDRAGREKMLESLKEGMHEAYDFKAPGKPEINQFLEMELNASKGRVSKEIIELAQPYDGYYALLSSDTHLSTRELEEIYNGLKKAEESFQILKTDLQARSAHVWSDSQRGGVFPPTLLGSKHDPVRTISTSGIRGRSHLCGKTDGSPS